MTPPDPREPEEQSRPPRDELVDPERGAEGYGSEFVDTPTNLPGEQGEPPTEFDAGGSGSRRERDEHEERRRVSPDG